MALLRVLLASLASLLLVFQTVPFFAEDAVKDPDRECELILSFEDQSEINKLEIENIKNVKLSNQYFGNTHGLTSLMVDFVKSEKAFLKYELAKDDLKLNAENFDSILVDIIKYSDNELNLVLSSHVKTESGDVEITKSITLEGKKSKTLELPLKDKDGKKVKGLILDISIIAENVSKKTPVTIDYIRLK